ncbi:uncharacterized protein LOC135488187 [Lineus longissimus]|uniref:uncharacterized protein LOC135488187 n=1 Tax=Lineus longissimus TaxID=88925 RepID=UPI002B4C3FB9
MHLSGCSIALLVLASVCTSTTVYPRSSSTFWPPSQYWDVKDFPNPRYDVNKCGRRGLSSFVCDPNNVLSTNDANRIDDAIRSVQRSTPCECDTCSGGKGRGFSMAVAIVPWLKLPPGVPRTDTEVQLTIEHFAVELNTNRWSFGYCKNDAVIVLSTNDRKIFTATGRTTNQYLPSYCVDKASNSAKSSLKRFRYADAIVEILNDYKRTLNNGGDCSYGGTSPWVIAVACVVPAILLISFCACIISRRRRAGYMESGGSGNGFFYGWMAGSAASNHHHHHGHHHHGGGSSWGGGGGGGGFSSAGGGGGGGASW